MKQKLICLTIIVMFTISILPLSITAHAPNPIKVTQEIEPGTAPLFSELTNIAAIKSSPDNNGNPIVIQGKPTPQPTTPKYALTIEIDYIEGHQPTAAVLTYMQNYYAQRSIKITYDTATTSIPLSVADTDGIAGISDSEFLAIEAAYNTGLDKAVYDANGDMTGVFDIPYKWVLFGTTVQGSSDIVGYTYCVGNSVDLVAGNYIYIADETDDGLTTNTNLRMGIEAVVLMHEFGHSVGICVVQNGNEIYCSNYNCVMSYLNIRNAGKINQWSYCSNHWRTINMGYYIA